MSDHADTHSNGPSPGSSSWVNRVIWIFIALGSLGFILSMCHGMSQSHQQEAKREKDAVTAAYKKLGIQVDENGKPISVQQTPVYLPPSGGYAMRPAAPNEQNARMPINGPCLFCFNNGGAGGSNGNMGGSVANPASADTTPSYMRLDCSAPPQGEQKAVAHPGDTADNAKRTWIPAHCGYWFNGPQVGDTRFDIVCVRYQAPHDIYHPKEGDYCFSWGFLSKTGKDEEIDYDYGPMANG